MDGMVVQLPHAEELIAAKALERLREMSPRCAKIVELRFFAGLTVEETAELMALSVKTVKRESQFARAWLETQSTGRLSA